jgi:hypothetical protein
VVYRIDFSRCVDVYVSTRFREWTTNGYEPRRWMAETQQ